VLCLGFVTCDLNTSKDIHVKDKENVFKHKTAGLKKGQNVLFKSLHINNIPTFPKLRTSKFRSLILHENLAEKNFHGNFSF
jgi:hypothetical protein